MHWKNHSGNQRSLHGRSRKAGNSVGFRETACRLQQTDLRKGGEDGLPEKPRVHEILEYLHEKKIPVALASSSKKATVLSHLEKSGITGYFQKIVTGDMVTHGKPSPDIYLKACEELGAAPEEVIAIEDSFNGIRSASAAGLHPIMVPDQLQPTEEILLLAEAKCDSLLDVKQLLEDKYLK